MNSAAGYRAAHERAIVVERTDRGVLRVWGRDPVKMVHGLVSNDVAGLAPGESVYATMLTPKGRMIADLRAVRREADVLIECDGTALAAVGENIRHYVPPLFARAEEASAAFVVIGVYGPSSEVFVAAATAGVAGPAIRMRTPYAGVPGVDLIVAAPDGAELREALAAAGAAPAGLDTLEVLRIEAGSPRWGAELDGDVIPLEAGLGESAISTSKGCYTGQEVIIRILHRGHVNRHLRGLLLEGPAPAVIGAELFRPGESKAVGRVTSSCRSPRLGQAVALAYVRREIEPDETLRLGGPDGADARVVLLPFPDGAASSGAGTPMGGAADSGVA